MTQFFKIDCNERNFTSEINSNPTLGVFSQLNKNPQKIFSDLILQPAIYSDSNFLDIFNFSLYYFLTSPQIQGARLKEIFENLKKFIYLNNKTGDCKENNPFPIFYFTTIQKSFTEINERIKSDCFFISKENLNSLEELIPFMQDLCIKLSQSSSEMTNNEYKSAENCHALIKSIYCRIKSLNEIHNNYNRERINFALAHYKQMDILPGCIFKKNNSSNSTTSTRQINSTKNVSSMQITNTDITACKSSFVTNGTDIKNLITNSNNETGNDYTTKGNQNSNYLHEKHYVSNGGKILSDDLIVLKAKTKNYNNNHFTREIFLEKFLRPLNVKESVIHKTLSEVAFNYFQKIKIEKIDPVIDYLNFPYLRKVFSNYFPEHLIFLIGSIRSRLLYDTDQNPATIDLLLLPNIYHPENKTVSSNISDHIKVFKNLNGILKILNKINANKALTHEFLNLDKVQDSQLECFYVNFDMQNKMNKSRPYINTNLIFYDEKVKMSSDISTFVFFKNLKLQALHVFFQEITMNSLKLIKSRRDLSVLIFSYLNKTYKLDNMPKEKSFRNLSFRDLSDGTLESSKKVAKNFKNSELVEESYVYSYTEFSKQSLNLVNEIELGELILEFFRYVINYFTYLKNQYNIRINKNFPPCKGFDYLKEKFHENIYNSNESYNLINHLFVIDEVLSLSKKDYDFVFCKKLNALEEIYFKICENSDKIKSMNQIIANINTNYSQTN
jgi:hypothetical protein